MAAQTEGVLETRVSDLLRVHGKVLDCYRSEPNNAERFAEALAEIEAINQTLDPQTHRFVTKTSPHKTFEVFDDVGGSNTTHYRLRNVIGEYGRSFYLIGDKLERVAGRLVLVDTVLRGGISVVGTLQVKPVEELHDSAERTAYENVMNISGNLFPGEPMIIGGD